MKATCTDKQTFELFYSDQLLGQLKYKNLFSLKAKIVLPNGDIYEIKPNGVFGTTISVLKDDTEISVLRVNWKGQVVITLQNSHEYLLKSNGVFMNTYSIENTEKEKLIEFVPKFNWKQFNYNYDILFEKRPDDIFLILLGIYAANYNIAMISGTVAAII